MTAHAGVGFAETSPDEDIDAIDGTLKFGRASAELQVKCTGGFKVGQGRATLPIESTWFDKWASSFHPVFVVLVKVPTSIPTWIQSQQSATKHRTVAFGMRFDPKLHKESMKFTKANHLTAETLYDWRDDVYAHYEGLGGEVK